MDAALEYDWDLKDTDTGFSNDSRNYVDVNSYEIFNVIEISTIIICILGVVGNGIVIWLLAFCVQRNPFMTFILNLAIADLGLLISAALYSVPFSMLPYFAFFMTWIFFFFLFYSASQFLLTAISIVRCVAVFFPLWHHCHRPPHLSAIVCALMWVLSLVLAPISLTSFEPSTKEIYFQRSFQFIVNIVLCLPLVTISTVALFIKVCFKPRQHQRGKILTILLLTLSSFLLFAFPYNVIFILIHLPSNSVPIYFPDGAMVFACLNSSVNPVIYFLVGRQRKTQHRETLKMILQRAFKEEEVCTEETSVET